MTTLVIGFDRDLLDPHSVAAARQRAFADTADVSLDILLLSRLRDDVDLRLSDRIRVRGWTGNVVTRFIRAFFVGVRAKVDLMTAQDPFIAGKLAFLISRFRNLPYEIQEHGDFYSGHWETEIPLFNRALALLGRFVLRRADGVRVVSERVRDHLVRRCGVSPDRVLVNPVALDVSWHLRRAARSWPETPTIVVPCRFVKQKGLDTLIDALARLRLEGVRFRARLIGKGPLESEIRTAIASRGLADIVVIEPWADQAALWNEADLFVCSSRYEGWGRTIIEAMAAGVPVVTTEVGAVGSVLRPQIDGRVVQPNDPSGLSNAIREQFDEPERRAWMAGNARERVKSVLVSREAAVLAQKRFWENIGLNAGGSGTIDRRGWMWGAAFIAFVSFIRFASMALFWQSLGANKDTAFYTLVQNWFLGNGYSFVADVGCASAYRSPGYLFFLTAVYGLFGFGNFFAQALIQNLLAVLLAYLVYRLAWAIAGDRRVGFVAGVLIALHPYAFYHYTQYYHTVLSSVLLVALLLVLVTLERTKRWRWAVVGGMLIAALAYIQGTIIPAMALLSAWLLVRWWPDWKRALKAVAIMAAISIALILPWTYRNWTVFNQFVFLTTDMGHAFAKANNGNAYLMNALGFPQEVYEETRDWKNLTSTYTPNPEVVAAFRAHGAEVEEGFFFNRPHPLEPGLRQTCEEQRQFDEVAFDAYWLGHAKRWIASHYWTEGLRLQIQKAVQFWTPTLQPSRKYGAAWSFGNESLAAMGARYGLAGYVLLMEVLAAASLLVIAKRKRFGRVAPLLIVIGTYTFMHSWFAGYTKYRIPIDNLVVILAAIAAVAAYDVWKKRRGGAGWRLTGFFDFFRVRRISPSHALKTGGRALSARAAGIVNRWAPWMTTAALLGFLAFVRLTAYGLFSERAAKIGDPGFMILVRNWFAGFGYSYVAQAGCPTAFRSPGYLFFLTGTYLAFGFENYRVLFLIQAALVVLAGYLLYRLGKAISGERHIGWIALALFAIYPYTVYHYAQYYHTFLSSLFLITIVFALVRLDQTKRVVWAAIAGLAIGCLALVQGSILPATPFLALWLFIRWRREWKKAFVAVALMAIVSAGVIAPWTYRNWTIFHRVVPLTTDVGFGLYKSNNPYAYGLNALGYPQEVISGESIIHSENPLLEKYFFTPDVEQKLRAHGWYEPSTYTTDWHPRPPGVRASCDLMSTLDEPELAAYWAGKTKEWIVSHPRDFMKLMVQKVVQFWSPGLNPSIKSETQWSFGTKGALASLFVFVNAVFVAIVDLFAIIGAVFIFRSKKQGSYAPMFIILAVYTVLHSVFAGYTKYRIPLDNLVFVLAAVGIAGSWKWIRERYGRTQRV